MDPNLYLTVGAPPLPVTGALNQGAYQTRIEELLSALSITEVNKDDTLRSVCELMGVGACFHVSATTGQRLTVRNEFSSMPISVQPLEESLRSRLLQHDDQRSRLISVPDKQQSALKGRNILFSRVGTSPSDPKWLDAVVFAGRRQPPIVNSSLGFVTFDFKILELVADCFASEFAQRRTRTSATFLSMQARLRRELAKAFGADVVIALGEREVTLSRIQPQFKVGKYANLGTAELAVMTLLGPHTFSNVRLNTLRKFAVSAGETEEFAIRLFSYKVLEEKITVFQLEASNERECTIPLGEWWFQKVQEPSIDEKQALRLAERHLRVHTNDVLQHQACGLLVGETGADLRLVHQVLLKGPKRKTKTLCIDAHTGEVVQELQAIWSSRPGV